MFMILVILVVHVDARCGVSEGVVQCRDWREFESGNYPMANFLILERAVGEINIEGYLALTRLVIHDPQADCDDIKTNPWTTVSLTCQVIIFFFIYLFKFVIYVIKKKLTIILILKRKLVREIYRQEFLIESMLFKKI